MIRISRSLFRCGLIHFLIWMGIGAAEDRVAGLPLGGPATEMASQTPKANSGDTVDILVRTARPGLAVSLENAFGADLAIWNKPERYEEFKPYLAEAGFSWFRFPDGSLSNDYHWNGEGSFDGEGVWTTTHRSYKPGFLVESRYRGTTKDNYGFRRPSHLTDGLDTTLWWGVVEDRSDPPWFVVDLGEAASVDSLQIMWGRHRPGRAWLLAWDSVDAPYPGPHQRHINHWKRIAEVRVKGEESRLKFASFSARFWAVRPDVATIPVQGMQVGEFRLWASGQIVTKNVADAGRQSKTWGISTHIGADRREDWVDIAWDFEKFMEWVQSVPNARPVICVNVGTGTPEEAASWVHYANKVRGYKIRDWQVGNENDGEWEEGGPLSATQYARRFIAFAKAMKRVDPTIRVLGPLHSTDEWRIKGDGLYSGRSWMETFLAVIGEAERMDKKIYLDGVDFHSYPYWFMEKAHAATMLHAVRRPGPMMDTLDSWMRHYLKGGESRRVSMSEFSTTVLGTVLTQQAVQGAAVAYQLADFIVRFGDRGHALPWDVYGGMQTGPDGSSGSLRLFNPVMPVAYSSWGNFSPSAQYHALFLAQRQWARHGLKVLPVEQRDSSLRAFALGSGDTTHVLLVNFREVPVLARVRLEREHPAAVQVFRFGDANFTWVGLDEKAYAAPGMGAWADRRAPSVAETLWVPPLGLGMLQWGSETLADEPVDILHMGSTRTVLNPGDTLDIWGTAWQRGGAVIGASYKSVWGTGNIAAADGLWGGEMEGLRLRLPVPANTKPGAGRIEITVRGSGNQAGAWVVPYRIQGRLRTVAALSRFDQGDLLQSEQSSGSEWFAYAHGDNGTDLRLEVIAGPAPLGGHLLGRFEIIQPKGQSWPNFVSAHLPLDRSLLVERQFGYTAGIVVDYATRHSNEQGYFQVVALSELVKDYDQYTKRLKNTRGQWVRDTILWSEMAQEGWGKPCGPLSPAVITQLEFQARGAGRGEMRLDNLMLLGEDGEEIPLSPALRRLR